MSQSRERVAHAKIKRNRTTPKRRPAAIAQPQPDQQRSTDAARLSHHQIKIILDGIADGVTAQDPNGQVIYANDAAALLAGYPSASALLAADPARRLHHIEMFDESGRALDVEELPGRLVLRSLDSSTQIIRFRISGTSEERWSFVKSHAVLNQAGQLEVVVNTFHDITDLKRAEIHQSV